MAFQPPLCRVVCGGVYEKGDGEAMKAFWAMFWQTLEPILATAGFIIIVGGMIFGLQNTVINGMAMVVMAIYIRQSQR